MGYEPVPNRNISSYAQMDYSHPLESSSIQESDPVSVYDSIDEEYMDDGAQPASPSEIAPAESSHDQVEEYAGRICRLNLHRNIVSS